MRSWNNYLLPLIMLDRETNYPWPLGIMAYQGEFAPTGSWCWPSSR